VQLGVEAVRDVVETVGVVRGLVDDGQWGAALDGVDDLWAMWDGPMAPAPPSVPSLQSSSLPSVAEEPLDDEEMPGSPGDELISTDIALEIPLSKLRAFSALPGQLQMLTQEITSSLTSDLLATLNIDLFERIRGNDSSSGDQMDVCDKLRPLVEGLVRTKSLRESVAEWRVVVLREVQGIVEQVGLLLLDLT
jgi:vacuolar protein sorting-associated protein 54